MVVRECATFLIETAKLEVTEAPCQSSWSRIRRYAFTVAKGSFTPSAWIQLVVFSAVLLALARGDRLDRFAAVVLACHLR
jgi:hypothetical protein